MRLFCYPAGRLGFDMADQDISTGGGSYNEGKASAGKDYVGRDQHNYARPENLSVDEKLNALFRLVVGDRLYNVTGLVEMIAEINRGLHGVVDDQRKATNERVELSEKIQRNYENAEQKFSQQSEEIRRLYSISIFLALGLGVHLFILLWFVYSFSTKGG